jgi:hypothetical protein
MNRPSTRHRDFGLLVANGGRSQPASIRANSKALGGGSNEEFQKI